MRGARTTGPVGGVGGALVALWCGGTALAAPPQLQAPTAEQLQPGTAPSVGGLGFFESLGRSNFLLCDMWGLRPFLSRYGMSFALEETSEVLGNVSGGNKEGVDYDGLTTALLQLDTNRAFGWYGGTFNVSALQYHGRSLSNDALGPPLQTVSGIEADRALRLWELWYDQKFLEEDRLDVKVGQQSLDQEFMVSANAALFVNTMFGWPMLPSADLPGGGPAYPLSALGVRLRAKPSDSLSFLAGVFNGSPAANNPIANATTDSQQVDPSGTNFSLNGGALVIAEMQYTYPSLGTMLYANQSEPLARTYKLGLWYDSESFADQRYDDSGVSLASPATTGIPEQHRGDYGLYAVADQLVWVDPNESDRTINVFARAMGTPEIDRNPVVFSANLGVTMHEPILHRDDDTVGVGMGYAKVGSRLAGLDRDTAFFTGSLTPVRSSETFVEVTYQYQWTPWLQVQPDLQYIFNPGGGLANAAGTGKIGDEAVFGVRTNILF
jgi:porin